MSCSKKYTMTEIEAALDKKLQPVLSKLDGLVDSVQFMSDKFDELNEKVKVLEMELANVVQENKQFKSDNLNLSNNMKMNRESMNNLEQYTRRECIEISGIPVQPDEDTDELVITLGSLMGINVNHCDISVSNRMPNSGNSNPNANFVPKIIAKFVRRSVRDDYYKARKKLRSITTADLGMTRLSHNKIYISERLTSINRELFNQCLEVKRQHKFKFLWTRYGRIFLRKDRDTSVIEVKSRKDIDNLKVK